LVVGGLAEGFVDGSLIVVDAVDPGKLGSALDEESDYETLADVRNGNKGLPVSDAVGFFVRDLFFHLVEFGTEEALVNAVVVQPLDGLVGFGVTALFEKPTRGEWKPEETADEAVDMG
jgi:hypothetical protein